MRDLWMLTLPLLGACTGLSPISGPAAVDSADSGRDSDSEADDPSLNQVAWGVVTLRLDEAPGLLPGYEPPSPSPKESPQRLEVAGAASTPSEWNTVDTREAPRRSRVGAPDLY